MTNNMKYIQKFWGIAFIIVAWLVFASPYIVKRQIPFPSKYLVTFFPPWSASYGMPVKNNAMPDVITQIYPWKRVTIETWKMGQIPLWNPYSFSGTLQAGNYQSAVFSPVNVLFLLLPEVHAWSLMILLQPLLAGIFMYIFLRSLLVSREASVLGSTAFMFCGFMVVWMAYGTLGYAALYLPLILYAVNIYEVGKRHWAGPLLSLGLCLSFFSGHFQISVYVLIFTLLYTLFIYLNSPSKRKMLHVIWWIGIGLLLSAPQILPSFYAYSAAARSGMFLKGEIIPWNYIVTIFSPDFYGNPVTRNDWFGHYAEWSSYFGVIPLLLVILSWFISRKNRHVIFFNGAGLVMFLFALPTPLTDLMYALHIPVLSTSAASRIVVLVSFSFAVVSAFALDALRDMWKKDSYKSLLPAVCAIAAVPLAVWVVLKVFRPLPPEKLTVSVHNSMLPTAFALGFIGVIAFGFMIRKRWRDVLPFILILFVSVDVLRFAGKWMPFDPQQFIYPRLPVIAKMQQLGQDQESRFFGNIGNEVGSAFGIPLIEGYDAVYQSRYGKFITAATDGRTAEINRSVVALNKTGTHAEDILELLGVRYIVHRVSDGTYPWAYPYWKYPWYHLIWSDPTYQLFENNNAMPRTFLASSYEIATGDDVIIAKLLSAKTNRRETLILETQPHIQPESGSGTVSISTYTPDRITLRVNTTAPKLLFLSDVYDSGWHASIDGKSTPIYRADFDFRAVAVPTGNHIVTMWYMPWFEAVGLITAGFALAVCIGYLAKEEFFQ